MMSKKILAVEESAFDCLNTAALFQATYPDKSEASSEKYFCWKYKKLFHNTSHSVVIFDGNMKIAQATIFQQRAELNGEVLPLMQLGDLAVHPNHRSYEIVSTLYKKLKEIIVREKYSALITIPNQRSVKLNKRFLKLANISRVAFHSGLCPMPLYRDAAVRHHVCGEENQLSAEIRELIQSHIKHQSGNRVIWTLEAFQNKLFDPGSVYKISWLNDLGLVTSRHKKFGIPYFLIRAILVGSSDTPTKKQWRKLLGQAARENRTPLWLYWGINKHFDALQNASPSRFKLSKSTLLQYSDLIENSGGLDCLELIDVDII